MTDFENEDCELYFYQLAHNNTLEAVTSFTVSISETDSTSLSEQDFDSANVTNFWIFFDEKFLKHSWSWTVTLIVAYTLIFIFGMIGNLMVILVVIKRRQMRTVTNMFIMNLAVADLFVILFCVPATLISNIFRPWILGFLMCKSVTYVQGVSVCASAYSLAAISIDRCRAIYKALGRPRGISKRQALSVICFIWIIALLLTIPWAVKFDVVFMKKYGMSYCVETWENGTYGKIYYLVANLFFCYCLPLILISTSNAIIWCHVKKRRVPQDSAGAASIKKMHRKTRHGVRRMLGIVNLAFLLSWLPLYILVTIIKFTDNGSDSGHMNVLLPMAQLLGSWNSSINPILYAFLNSKFREMFKSLLPQCSFILCEKRSNIIVTYSTGQQTIRNEYITAGSRATYFSTGRKINQNSRLSCGAKNTSKDWIQKPKKHRVRKLHVSKHILVGSPKDLIIVVTSPTSSSSSVVNDQEKVSFYFPSSVSNSRTSSSLEHV